MTWDPSVVPLRAAFDARDAFQADLRGWGRYAADLLEALARRDDVRVVPYAGGGRLPEIAWEQVGWPARLWSRGAGRPDVLHAPNCFLPLVRPCPGVVTVHDLAFETHPDDFAPRTGWKYRTFTRRAVRSAEAVICVSQATADDVLERYGADPGRVHVVPNGPSLPLGPVVAAGAGALAAGPAPGVPGLAADDDRPYLLAIGDLRAKKNLERLADAWRLSGLQHRLVIVGAGGTRPADTPEGRLAAGLRARGAELPGYLPDAELDALLRGATALVHPSLFEGFGLVVLEAMVRGVPVACSDIPSLRETAGGAAALFNPLDVEDLARGLHDVVDRAGAYGPAGQVRASGFSWDRAAEETAAVYRLVTS